MTDQYSRLLEWRRAEGATRGLAKLPHDFYESTAGYLAESRRTFETELRADPAGKKGEVARQTYQRAAQIARDVIEARMLKVLNLAFQASVGGGRELTNSLAEERELYDRLVASLRGHRTAVAPFLEPTAPSPAATPAAAATAPRAAPVAPGPVRGGRALVRILQDRPAIEVGGETVDLRREDVLTLPAEAARLLVEAKVAELLHPTEIKRSPPP